MSKPAITGATWGLFIKNALIWLIPALLMLPLYMLVLAVSILASEGALLEGSSFLRGKINSALGPLVCLSGVAALGWTAVAGSETQDYVNGGIFALVAFGLGIVLIQRELHRLVRSSRAQATK